MKFYNISGSRLILLAALIFLLTFPCVAYGAGTSGDIGIYLNGSKVSSDVSPYIDGNSRTMVPLRFIAERMGAYVDWSEGTRIITIKQKGQVLILAIGSSVASVGDETVRLDTQPVLKEGRTMVPLRFVSEQLGCMVSWNIREQAVYISAKEDVAQKVVVSLSSASNANIRTGPGTSFPILSTVKNGTVLNAVSSSGGWYQVLLADNSKGWISGTLVRPTDGKDEDKDEGDDEDKPSEDDDGPGINGNSVIIVSDESVNVRQSASADSAKVATVYKGQEFVALGQQGDWYKIRTSDGQVGWVAGWLAAYKVAPSSGLPSRGDSDALRGKIIVIDPGHGSLQKGGWSDPGAVSPSGHYERDIVSRIATTAGKVLSDQGATVIYTRTSSKTSITLSGRAQVANDFGADVFVAIHCNSSETSSTSGTSTYYWAPGDMDMWQQQSRQRLATLVQQELVEALGRRNIGIIQERFLVLRETVVPSILVETAFLSNPEEEQLLLNYNFQEKAGKAIARGIIEYLGN